MTACAAAVMVAARVRRADGTLMAASVTPLDSGLDFGKPVPLFRPGLFQSFNARYRHTTDGRFLVNVPASQPSITVVVNWIEEFKRIAVQ